MYNTLPDSLLPDVRGSLVDHTTPSTALDILHHQCVLVMQYIQRCRGSDLVNETSVRGWLHELP